MKDKTKKIPKALLRIGILFGIAAVLFLARDETTADNDAMQAQIAQKILRFHVIANSDSKEDQRVKLLVRDAVGNLMEERLLGAKNLEESRKIVEKNLDEIVQTATDTLADAGYEYGATASLEVTEFPEKTYGSYTFPAGEYEALRVVLGKGEGHNWWCVLYPNLCFRGSVYEVIDEDAKEELKEVLDAEEYESIFRSGRVLPRLKFLEFFRKSS